MNRNNLPDYLFEILNDLGGRATIVETCKHFWEKYETELRASDDLFYTWQYDIRWAATELRKTDRMIDASSSERGMWEINK